MSVALQQGKLSAYRGRYDQNRELIGPGGFACAAFLKLLSGARLVTAYFDSDRSRHFNTPASTRLLDLTKALSRFGRFAAAISIGLAVEILLFIGAGFIGSEVPQPWGDRLAVATQEPAYHLVNWFAKVHPPGFEEQAAYAMLIPLMQWMIWNAIFYMLLSRKKRSSSV